MTLPRLLSTLDSSDLGWPRPNVSFFIQGNMTIVLSNISLYIPLTVQNSKFVFFPTNFTHTCTSKVDGYIMKGYCRVRHVRKKRRRSGRRLFSLQIYAAKKERKEPVNKWGVHPLPVSFLVTDRATATTQTQVIRWMNSFGEKENFPAVDY